MAQDVFALTATGGGRGECDTHEVYRALAVLVDMEHGVELQALPSGRTRVIPADDLDLACQIVEGYADDRGVYWMLNPVPPDLGRPGKVADVLYRRWLLIDVDRVKREENKNDSATEAEKEATRAAAQAVMDFLGGRGWPAPVLVDSGNGWHLLYRINLPNDDASRVLLRELLKALAARFDTPEVDLDKKVHNANRVSKLPGTMARKGVNTPERPHRMCRLVSVPAFLETVPCEELQATLDSLRAGPQTKGAQDGGSLVLHVPAPGTLAYATAALDREAAKVALAPPGTRNETLFQASISLGQLVAGGVLVEAEVRDRLALAASRAGLEEGEVRATLDSGFSRGLAEPRGVPDRNGVAHTATPGSPPPEPEEWPEPVPLTDVPDVERFPIDVLPPPLQDLCAQICEAMNVPPDFPAATMLGLAGGAVANSYHLAITRTHVQAPCLYLAVVSPPGSVKSPVLRLLRRPFDEEHHRRQAEWRNSLSTWEASERTEARPRLSRCVVDDITTESLGLILTENPRGVVMVRPELSALFTGLNQYKQGKGHDRQVYLKLWDGDTIIIDRKSDRSQGGAPLYVTDPFCGIIGTIQPSVVRGMRGDRRSEADDGSVDRYLFCYPDPLAAREENWREVSRSSLSCWSDVVVKLLALQMTTNEEGAPRANRVTLGPGGRAEWEHFTRLHALEVNAPLFPDHLKGPWSKLRGYAGRLALILHFLRFANGELGKASDLDDVSMRGAGRLIAYFKSHARRVYAVMDADRRVAAAKKIVAWLLRERREEFKRWEAHKDLSSDTMFPAPDSMDEPLRLLEAHQFVRLKPSPVRPGPGRRAADVWLVNPLLMSRENRVNRENDCAAFIDDD